MICLPPLILLELHFKASAPINNLPFYHGAHWSALFRNILKPYLPASLSMAEADIWVQTVETGRLSYEKGEKLHLGLSFPVRHRDAVATLLKDFNRLESVGGHFQPEKTVLLEEVICRINGATGDWRTFSEDLVREETERLSSLESFHIHFFTPLRLPRPGGSKIHGHHYCDESFFLDKGLDRATSPLGHLLTKIRLSEPEATFLFSTGAISGGALTWLDLSYGEELKKTLGGVVGMLKVSGRPSPETAGRFVMGQYTGVGKNPVFGLGFYNIPELDSLRKIRPLSRGGTLLHKALAISALRASLNGLPNSSPGPDMLSVADMKKAGSALLESLSKEVIAGSYLQGRLKKYRMPKPGGGFREIQIQNVTDRLVHKALADCLAPVVDGLLSSSSYAYRRGLNRKGAATVLREELRKENPLGIKADISAFFDSVNIELLGKTLKGLFPFEPLVDRIMAYLSDMNQSGISGLPQGSPLSPVLSNIYLAGFDRNMEEEGFRLIRYADDFIVMFQNFNSYEEGLAKVRASLSRLGLCLKDEKTTEIKQGKPITFLGYLITQDDITETAKLKDENEHAWPPVFREDWRTGQPVYLTSICRGAHSSGPSLVIHKADDSKEDILWNSISRLVVVGRSNFSGGVVYRAIKEEIPVSFIDVLGRTKGRLYPEHKEMPEMLSLQEQYAGDREWSLNFAREIISAKIHNSAVLLKRNALDAQALRNIIKSLRHAPDMDSLRGYEGAAANIYFSEFAKLTHPFEFKSRVYHPPDGPVNIMLSFGYSLLYNRLDAALKDKGFNTRLGFYHKGRGTHSALASDLLEELRHLAERVTLSLIHLKEIKPEDFILSRLKGAEVCRLAGEGFRQYIHRFEKSMSALFISQDKEKLSYNTCLDEMADRLKRALKLKIPYCALKID